MMRFLPLVLLAGCTFTDGEPFARLDARLNAGFAAVPERDAGDGFQRLASDYQVKLTRFSLEIPALELLATGEEEEEAGDDHGHAHKLAGEEARVVVELPVGELDLLAGAAKQLECEPSCDLPAAQIAEIHAPVAFLRLEGTVRDGRSEPRIAERAFVLELALDAELHGELELPADREHAVDVTLAVSLSPDVSLLDGVDFAAPELDPTGVGEAFLATPLAAEVSR